MGRIKGIDKVKDELDGSVNGEPGDGGLEGKMETVAKRQGKGRRRLAHMIVVALLFRIRLVHHRPTSTSGRYPVMVVHIVKRQKTYFVLIVHCTSPIQSKVDR
jgi:hypothetical protein